MKTLALLASYKIPKERIDIFVADEEQETLYKQIPEDWYGRIIVGKKGLKEQRNFITLFYPEGTHLVCMDDDLESIQSLVDGTLTPLADLHGFLETAFQTLEGLHLKLWGIYPVYNKFFMKDSISTDLKFCIGHMHGILNSHKHLLTLTYKEDYERTLQYALDSNGVLRYNGIVAKTKMGASGGLGKSVKDRLEENKKSSEYLLEKYPGLVRLNPRRPGEILLARKVR